MSTLYLSEQFSTVRIDADTLLVSAPVNAQMGRTAPYKKRFPLEKITQLVIYGQVTLTTAVIHACSERGIDVVYLTLYGKFIARITGREHKHARLRLLQTHAHHDPTLRLLIGKVCVRTKLHNQRTLLLRGHRSRPDPAVAAGAAAIGELIDRIDALPADDIPPPDPTRPQHGTVYGVLMGIEGAAAAAYFPAYAALLAADWQPYFTKRQKRPPRDPVNALLSYGYSLLTNQVAGAAQTVGFDPYIGYLHSTQYGKPALALDLVEMFRAPVVDSVVLTLLNNRMLNPADFDQTLGAWRMNEDTRRLFLTKYEERLNTSITHPLFKTKVTYRRCIDLQMRLLSRWLLGELKRFRGFTVR